MVLEGGPSPIARNRGDYAATFRIMDSFAPASVQFHK
jgi:hypothetical protein